jgi:hypothetical protein
VTERRDDSEQGHREEARADAASVRRPYQAPELVEYGTVAKLTQTGGGSRFDFNGMMMMACL